MIETNNRQTRVFFMVELREFNFIRINVKMPVSLQ